MTQQMCQDVLCRHLNTRLSLSVKNGLHSFIRHFHFMQSIFHVCAWHLHPAKIICGTSIFNRPISLLLLHWCHPMWPNRYCFIGVSVSVCLRTSVTLCVCSYRNSKNYSNWSNFLGMCYSTPRKILDFGYVWLGEFVRFNMPLNK